MGGGKGRGPQVATKSRRFGAASEASAFAETSLPEIKVPPVCYAPIAVVWRDNFQSRDRTLLPHRPSQTCGGVSYDGDRPAPFPTSLSSEARMLSSERDYCTDAIENQRP
ncbi:hypothetical protein GCM10011614_19070 [Novosphingobium colocasiae]|uniref:Uncharacterized protein n=1 Tax=Novosphingobium colocasiae TaxID=1256513 RepID=A0A918PER9_9SPHN|nr:hypothetical protein GCM10011614_19070 [Novosphingobium colocasiae]